MQADGEGDEEQCGPREQRGDAVAQFDSQEARDLLLSFIDPTLPPLSNELIRHHDGRLVRRLAELAQRDVAVLQQIFGLAQENIPAAHAVVLGKVLANLGTTDALLASLQLLRDNCGGGTSYELHKNIEEALSRFLQYSHDGAAQFQRNPKPAHGDGAKRSATQKVGIRIAQRNRKMAHVAWKAGW